MTAGLWVPTNTTLEKIAKGQFDFDSDTWKCALLLSTSNIGIASTTHAGVTNEHANANGYTTGGVSVAFTFSAGTITAVSDAVWGTPSGQNVTITSAGSNLPVLSAGTMFRVRDHSNAANEGLYVATGSPSAASLPATKLAATAPASAASEAISIKQPDKWYFTTDPAWTAAGGPITARYGEIYEVSGDVAFYNLLDNTPADVTTASGYQLTINSDTSNPVFTVV